MSALECLVTGITLHCEGRCWPADLFYLNGILIVNAVGEGRVRPLREGEKVFSFSGDHEDYFERRNVYVFTGPAEGYLNQAALDYIERGYNV